MIIVGKKTSSQKIRKGEIVINTSEKSIKQVIEEILIVVKEKKSKKKLNVWKCV